MKLFPLIFCLFIFFFKSSAQTPDDLPKNTYTVGANIFKGIALQHDNSLAYLAGTYPGGLEISIDKNNYGNQPWQQLYNYPDVGLSLTYFDMNNEEVLGKVVAAIIYLRIHLRRSEKSELFFRLGTGVGYSTNPYDPEDNTTNTVISSTLTQSMQGRLGYNHWLGNRFKLTSALTLTHFSNGAIKKPNKGINIPSLNFGMAYALFKETPEYFTHDLSAIDKKPIHFNLLFAGGVKERDQIGDKKYAFYALSFFADKQISRRSRLNLGLEGFMDFSARQDVREGKQLDPGEEPDYKRAGIALGHDLLLGKVALLIQFGVYIYRPYKSDKPIYQKYGLKYFFSEKYFASMLLKVHYGKADAMEWGIGVRF